MTSAMYTVHDCAECGANAIWVDWARMPLCRRCEAIIDEELEEQARVDALRDEWEYEYDRSIEDRLDEDKLSGW